MVTVIATETHPASPTLYPVGGANPRGGIERRVVAHANGTLLAFHTDTVTPGLQTPIKFTRSTDGGKTWIAAGSIQAPVPVVRMSLAVDSQGRIGVAITNQYSIRFTLLTCDNASGTWNGTWTTTGGAGWEIAYNYPSTPGFTGQLDIDFSSSDRPIIAWQTYDGTLYTGVFYRTALNTWTQPWTITNYPAGEARRDYEEALSIAWIATNDSLEQFVVVYGSASSQADHGISAKSLRISPTTGALNSSVDIFNNRGPVWRFASTSPAFGTYRAVQVIKHGNNIVGPTNFSIMHFVFDFGAYRYRTEVLYGSITATGTYVQSEVSTFDEPGNLSSLIYGVAMTVDANRNYIFHYVIRNGNGTQWAILSTVYYWADNGTTRLYSSQMKYLDYQNVKYITLGGGPRKNSNSHPFVGAYQTSDGLTTTVFTGAEIVPNRLDDSSAVISLVPNDGASQQTSQPNVLARVQTGEGTPAELQSLYRIQFQFSPASDFSYNIYDFTQSKTKLAKVSGVNNNTSTINFSDTVSAISLPKGVWYYRARLMDIFGGVGAWSAVQSFSVGHPPSAIIVSPKGNGLYEYDPFNYGWKTFIWDFFDISPGDTQTAYQFILRKTSDNSIIVDSGKQSFAGEYYDNNTNLGEPLKDQSLNWTVRLWDSEDTAGPYAPAESFILTDPPSVTIESPTDGETVYTGVPTILFTPSTGGDRGIKSYTVTVTQGASVVWSKTVNFAVPVEEGVQRSIKVDQGYLENYTYYSAQVMVVDSGGMTGFSPLRGFNTAWTPPDAPTGVTVDMSQYNVEENGYVLLEWDDDARDPDFASWRISRKADMIDPATGVVVEPGEWVDLGTDYSIQEGGYQFRDYLAPSTYEVTYRVVQWVNRIGQDIPSDPTESAPVVPTSDGYWLIEPSLDQLGSDAFKLSIVTADDFNDEQEETEFIVIGRGRVVNKGQRLGNKGTLSVQLRNTGGTTARQKRLRLKELQKRTRQLYLRNPFGDIFRVSVSSISISRLAGVGTEEFCDVSIPYSEVS